MKRFVPAVLAFAIGLAVGLIWATADKKINNYPTRVHLTIPPGGKSGQPNYVPSRTVELEPRMITFPETTDESIDLGDIKTVPPWKIHLEFRDRSYCIVADYVNESP